MEIAGASREVISSVPTPNPSIGAPGGDQFGRSRISSRSPEAMILTSGDRDDRGSARPRVERLARSPLSRRMAWIGGVIAAAFLTPSSVL